MRAESSMICTVSSRLAKTKTPPQPYVDLCLPAQHQRTKFLLMIALILFSGTIATAQPTGSNGILPINFVKLGDVALVEDIPNAFYTDQAAHRDERWRQARWSSLLRRKMHPTLLDDIIKSYETNGLKNPPDGFSYDDNKYFETFFRDCFPRKVKLPWTEFKLTEFEKVRAMRAFYSKHRAEIDKYDVDLPMTIGAIQEVKLDDYDRAKQRFRIDEQQASSFAKGNRVPLRYRFEQPRESLRYLPMAPQQAEQLLGQLEERKLHLMETHQLVKLELHPDVSSGAVGVLNAQKFTVFIPDQYKTPIYVQNTKSLDSVANDKEPLTEASGGELNKKMAALCREMRLFNIGGIPVSGSLPYGLLSRAQEKAFNDSQQRLADRILLGVLPRLLSPEIETLTRRSSGPADSEPPVFPRDLKLLSRVLGEATISRYANPLHGTWVGNDIFSQKESLQRFLKEQGPTIRKLTIKPPFRFRTIDLGHVGDYDFEAEQFPVKWFLANRVTGMRTDFGLHFSQSRSFSDNESLNITSPIAYPKFWKVAPENSRKAYQSLQTVRSNVRAIYASTVFDVIQSPRVTPAYTGSKFGQHKPDGLLISPVSMAIYADGACRKLIRNAPLIVPGKPVLQTARPNYRKEELYLWQPEVQIALLDQLDSSLVQPADLVVAAMSVFQEDAEYYEKGTLLTHRIRASDRANLLNRRYSSKREQGWFEFWDQDYQPFFPRTFFGVGDGFMTTRVSDRLRDEHFEVLRKWLRQRLKNVSGEFRLEASISVDRKNGTATLRPGDSNRQDAPGFGDLKNVDSMGAIAKLTFPDGADRRRYDSDNITTDFSVVYPAMSSRLTFAVDPEKLPAYHSGNNDDSFKGDVVVQIEKVEHVIAPHNGPQALIYIRPIRFEILGATDSTLSRDDRLLQSGKTAAVLPVAITAFTQDDVQREAEEKKQQADAAREQKRREEAAAEMQRQKERKRIAEQRQKDERKAEAEREKLRLAKQRRDELDRERQKEEAEAYNRKTQEQNLQRQLEADEQWREEQRRYDAESESINARCNELLNDGYASADIDWATGELLPGRERSFLGTALGFVWYVIKWIFKLAMLTVVLLFAWRLYKTNQSTGMD